MKRRNTLKQEEGQKVEMGGRDGWMDAKDSFTYVHVSVASIL